MVGKSQKSHGARPELNSVFDLEKVNRWDPIRTSATESQYPQFEVIRNFCIMHQYR
jgi:hypothetical protein